ncbi:MAG: DUF1868 domain-containing protein [Roseobacter sp.]
MSACVEISRFLDDTRTTPPHGFGQRYDRTKFLPEAGNTVVCPLDFDAPAHAAVLEARRRIMASSVSDHFIFTPPSSLHMTVFEGVIETRRTPNTWPADIGSSATVEQANEVILTRLEGFQPPPAFATRVTGIRPTGLILKGATKEDEKNMRHWRESLTVPFGYRHDAHDRYTFHMTFAYPVQWLPASKRSELETEFALILADLMDAAPVLPLRPPAFCQFADMEQFDELLVLET